MHRDRSLDFLRGTAILFMISTHAIGTFYSGQNPIIEWISWWGGTVCFTIFLFVFGAVYGLKLYKGVLDTRHEMRRAFLMLLGYYVLALWVYIFGEWKFGGSGGVFFGDVFAILRFEKLMYFTEFVLAFVLYILIILITQHELRRILQRPLVVILGSFGLYILGKYLYSLSWNEGIMGIIKAHMVGNGAMHSFPLLSYAPVMFGGMVWGFWLRITNFDKRRWIAVFAGCLLGMFAAQTLLGFNASDRFPPSITFLTYGMTYVFSTLLVFPLIERVKFLEWPLFYMGKHAFSFYALHIVLMIPVGYLLGGGTESVVRTIFWLAVILLAIVGFITAKMATQRH